MKKITAYASNISFLNRVMTVGCVVVVISFAECPKEVVVIKSVSNAFRSPGYPIHNYDNNADCSWSIQVPQSYNVELSFPRGFSLQGGTSCPYDFVEIRNGPNVTDRLLGKFCGDVTPSDIHSDGRYMFVRFKSDSTFTSKGFEASFRAVQPGLFRCFHLRI